MADTYWGHPARREIKRLIDLGDANAILDELHDRTTEWDDAREALDCLVRGANYFNSALVETVAAADAERDRLAEQTAIVEKFCAARAEYITAINNCHPDNYADYHRWQGHAEGRRQLSQELGLPVGWPPGYEEKAAGAKQGTEDGS